MKINSNFLYNIYDYEFQSIVIFHLNLQGKGSEVKNTQTQHIHEVTLQLIPL